jgi:hypothetical protein
VIEEWYADHRSCFGNSAREGHVLLARRGIAAWVIVHEDQRACCFAQCETQWISRCDVQAVNASSGDTPRCAQAVTPVERQDPELLVIERGHARACPRFDSGAVGYPWGRSERCCKRCAPPELDGGHKASGLRRAQPRALCELTDARACQTPDTAMVVEQRRCHDGDGCSSAARSKHERDQLGVAQAIDPNLHGSLARADPRCGNGHGASGLQGLCHSRSAMISRAPRGRPVS